MRQRRRVTLKPNRKMARQVRRGHVALRRGFIRGKLTNEDLWPSRAVVAGGSYTFPIGARSLASRRSAIPAITAHAIETQFGIHIKHKPLQKR